jgi:hypothetical protein
MYIRRTPIAFHPAIECITCGQPLEPDIEIATAYDYTDVELGPVCTACLESDPAHLHRRIQHQLDTLHERIAVLEYVVNEDHALTHHN